MERRDPGTAGARSLGERALRRELDLELPGEVLTRDSLFSPTKDATTRSMRWSASSRPRPRSSTPQLLKTTSRWLIPASWMARMR